MRDGQSCERFPDSDLKEALSRDRGATEKNNLGDAGAFPAGGLEMNAPEWLKPGVYGAVIGAVFVGVVVLPGAAG